MPDRPKIGQVTARQGNWVEQTKTVPKKHWQGRAKQSQRVYRGETKPGKANWSSMANQGKTKPDPSIKSQAELIRTRISLITEEMDQVA